MHAGRYAQQAHQRHIPCGHNFILLNPRRRTLSMRGTVWQVTCTSKHLELRVCLEELLVSQHGTQLHFCVGIHAIRGLLRVTLRLTHRPAEGMPPFFGALHHLGDSHLWGEVNVLLAAEKYVKASPSLCVLRVVC